jgi:hypothetical protein
MSDESFRYALTFAGEHPFLSFFSLLVVCQLVFECTKRVCDMIHLLHNRHHRHKNIQIHGYPPPHCDADGDAK